MQGKEKRFVRPCGPPPLRGGGVFFVAWDLQSHAMEYQDFQSEKDAFFHIIVFRTCKPLRACGFGNPHFGCAGFGNPSQQDSRSFLDKTGKYR